MLQKTKTKTYSTTKRDWESRGGVYHDHPNIGPQKRNTLQVFTWFALWFACLSLWSRLFRCSSSKPDVTLIQGYDPTAEGERGGRLFRDPDSKLRREEVDKNCLIRTFNNACQQIQCMIFSHKLDMALVRNGPVKCSWQSFLSLKQSFFTFIRSAWHSSWNTKCITCMYL